MSRFIAEAHGSVVISFGRAVLFIALVFVATLSARALDISVGPPEIIYSASQPKKLGHWPDGNLGVVPNGNGTYDFYGANGSKPAKTTGTLTDPGTAKKSVSIKNLPKKTFNYVAGGPIYQDPATGARLMVYHAEKHGKSKKDFYSVLGLAISTDVNGRVFNDLGTIIEPNLPAGRAEVGGGSFTVFDDYFHVYYRDTFAHGGTSELAVARASVSELVGNALSGRGTEFTKYYSGNWSQPGRGGLSSPLEIGNPGNSWMSVSHNDYLDQLVMVSSQWEPGGGDLYLATSPDGVNWSSRQPLVMDAGEQFYPTLIGTGPDPTHTDQSFYVYYTDSKKGAWKRWKDARLVRREITIDPFGNATQLPLEDPSSATDWAQISDFQSDFQSVEPAAGWKYAWNPTGQLFNPGAFAPLLWSESTQAYNTTGGALQLPTTSLHPDDYLMLSAYGGHPGHPGYSPLAGYTIQPDDGAGLYRIADSSIRKADGTVSLNEDGLQVLVYVNGTPIGSAQSVSTNGLVSGFDRDLGELNVGDTIWVIVDPLKTLYHDSFAGFDFTIQKSIPTMQLLSATAVPEPNAALLLLSAIPGCLRRTGVSRGYRQKRFAARQTPGL